MLWVVVGCVVVVVGWVGCVVVVVGWWLVVGCGLWVGGLVGCGCGLWVAGCGLLGWWVVCCGLWVVCCGLVSCVLWFKAGLERVYRSSNSQASPVTTAYRRPICLYRDSPEGRKSRTLQEGYYDDISFV